ncbi:hypothetical protein GCM10010129_03850 [Streptomyces fumigatiscleroticus]|nr:hypothetical protein GCM10010129_03850 [Streptomyces fumigatiscleroticus]
MVHGVVTTLRSETVARHDRPLTTHEPGRVADLLAAMTAELPRAHPGTAGVGIGVGGLVQDRAVVGESPFLRWRDVPLAGLVAERTLDGWRGGAVSLLTISSIRHQVRAATGRDLGYEEILALAAAGEPLPSRVVDEAARALGIRVAQIASFVLPQKVLLAGEGVGLMDVAGGTVEETVRAHRHPPAAPVDLEGLRLPRLIARRRRPGHPGPGAGFGTDVNATGTHRRCR